MTKTANSSYLISPICQYYTGVALWYCGNEDPVPYLRASTLANPQNIDVSPLCLCILICSLLYL